MGNQAQEPRTRPTTYLSLTAAFWTGVGALPLLSRRMRDAAPPQTGALELVQMCAATYYVSRVVTQERAGSWVREAFVEPKPGAGEQPVVGDQQQPTGQGLRAAVGELVTCSRCVGLWSAAALQYMRTLAPAHSRAVLPVLAAAGVNNFLQAHFAEVTARATAEQERAQQMSGDSAGAEERSGVGANGSGDPARHQGASRAT